MIYSNLKYIAFQTVKSSAGSNLKDRQFLETKFSPTAVTWANLVHSYGVYLPRVLGHVYVSGYENLPLEDEAAPIIAFSHKKLHDFPAMVEMLAARPFNRFHPVAAIGQAGIFNGVYYYQDWIPSLIKSSFPNQSANLARWLGKHSNRIFKNLGAYPAWRPEMDIPSTEREYRDSIQPITQVSYQAFKKNAASERVHSIRRVLKLMHHENYSLIIAPEGKYCHDGSVAPLQDFLGMAAYQEQKPTVLVSLSYDELCPDRWGRIDAWLNLSEPIVAPQEKKSISLFLANAGQQLQNNTVVTMSHLIAIAEHY